MVWYHEKAAINDLCQQPAKNVGSYPATLSPVKILWHLLIALSCSVGQFNTAPTTYWSVQ